MAAYIIKQTIGINEPGDYTRMIAGDAPDLATWVGIREIRVKPFAYRIVEPVTTIDDAIDAVDEYIWNDVYHEDERVWHVVDDDLFGKILPGNEEYTSDLFSQQFFVYIGFDKTGDIVLRSARKRATDQELRDYIWIATAPMIQFASGSKIIVNGVHNGIIDNSDASLMFQILSTANLDSARLAPAGGLTTSFTQGAVFTFGQSKDSRYTEYMGQSPTKPFYKTVTDVTMEVNSSRLRPTVTLSADGAGPGPSISGSVATIQHAFLRVIGDPRSRPVIMFAGTHVYASLDEAVNNPSVEFDRILEINRGFINYVYLGSIAMRADATDLIDPNQARFSSAGFNGDIMPMFGSKPGSIDTLTDVDITTVAPLLGQTLTWNGTNWTPGNVITINNTSVVADIAARDLLTPGIGDAAVITGPPPQSFLWDGTAWIEILTPAQVVSINNKTGVVLLSINDLNDVDTLTAAPALDQVLQWNGSNWVPGTLESDPVTFVANPTALRNVDVTNLDHGDEYFIYSTRQSVVWNANLIGDNGDYIPASNPVTGRWVASKDDSDTSIVYFTKGSVEPIACGEPRETNPTYGINRARPALVDGDTATTAATHRCSGLIMFHINKL